MPSLPAFSFTLRDGAKCAAARALRHRQSSDYCRAASGACFYANNDMMLLSRAPMLLDYAASFTARCILISLLAAAFAPATKMRASVGLPGPLRIYAANIRAG